MAITAGLITRISNSDTKASLSATAASGGTAPYTYQWYKSVISGFTPGAGSLIAGATALTLNDTGLIPSTGYYYKLRAIDSLAATIDYAQVLVQTLAQIIPQNNLFQVPILGQLDLRFNDATMSVQIDVTQANPVIAGQAVKIIDSLGGIPKVVACLANSDEVFGFINFDIKSQAFNPGDKCEISQAGNVMFMYATTAMPRGSQVTLDITSVGGVGVLVAASGAKVVGYAVDKALVPGALIRVKLRSPSFLVA